MGPLTIAIGSLTLLGLLKVPGWVQAIVAPPEAGLTGPGPEITPVANFYRVSKNFVDPVVREAGWRLHVGGLVDRPLDLAYRELARLPWITQVVTLECISNEVGGGLMSTGRFTGVLLRDLLAMAGPRAGAAAVNFHSTDRYTESLPLGEATGAPDILVAVLLGGAPLSGEHGFPARVLIPGRYGMKGPKWLDRIEVAAAESGGLWEDQGWNPAAAVRTTSRIDSPREGAVLRRAMIPLAGVAFAGDRGIQAVEWSADAGRSWSRAELSPALSPLTWVLWRATWTPAADGTYTLVVRARDGAGALQSAASQPSYPAGASGYHKVHVAIGG
ncbi:MAG TPA: molybdopterin-dependent oxidoreductase [Candidatus Dormibacteraeota bacterium]|nr:molybdopterin-dependent oxidoreductase [Candidatus Dormibacteraeota bacterium]